MVEAAINKAIDEALTGDDVYEKLGMKIAGELKKLVGPELAMKIKANWVDKIDGEDDIPDV